MQGKHVGTMSCCNRLRLGQGLSSQEDNDSKDSAEPKMELFRSNNIHTLGCLIQSADINQNGSEQRDLSI